MRENFGNYNLKNLVNKRINCVCKETHYINAEIYYEDFLKGIKKVINKEFPFSKVAIISTSTTFEKIGQSLVDGLKENGNIPLNVIIDQMENKIEKVSTLFCLPEDIRCVIAFDVKLINVLSYFAEIKNLPLIFVPISVNVKDLFLDKVNIMVGGKEDKIKITTKKHVIIDEKIIETDEKELSSIYVNALGNFISVLDLRVNNLIFNKKGCEDSLYLLKQSSFEIIKNLSKKKKTKLIEEQLKIEIVNNFSKDKVYTSSFFAVEKVLKALIQTEEMEDYKIHLVFYLLEIYKLYFSKQFEEISNIPDYTKRAEDLSLITKEKEIDIIKRLKENLLNFFEFEKKLKKPNSKLIKYINLILKHKKKFMLIYKSLTKNEGKIDTSIMKKAIFHAPDLLENYVTLSLVRESGILENLL